MSKIVTMTKRGSVRGSERGLAVAAGTTGVAGMYGFKMISADFYPRYNVDLFELAKILREKVRSFKLPDKAPGDMGGGGDGNGSGDIGVVRFFYWKGERYSWDRFLPEFRRLLDEPGGIGDGLRRVMYSESVGLTEFAEGIESLRRVRYCLERMRDGGDR